MPTTYFIISGQHEVTLRTNSPTASAIESALRSAPIIVAGRHGNFVGSARIVRRAYFLPPGGRITQFAWLYALPDSSALTPPQNATRARSFAPVLLQQVSDALHNRLDHGVTSSDWSNIAITPYSPTSNGTIEWWSSGLASHTATRDEFALNQQAGQFEQLDAPAGPTGERPTSVPNPIAVIVDPLVNPLLRAGESSGLKILGALILTGIGLYYLGPALGVVASRAAAAPSRPARANPIGFVPGALMRPGELVEWWPTSENEAAKYEGILRIGARGRVMHDPRGRVRKVDGVDSMAIRFENGVVRLMPLTELGIPSELAWNRHRAIIA